ncbi:MAG: hypothetical protein JW703_04015 [Candidatus Diapherotrites archaeon]|nr:hypothetical protein [Candidatus Diapherotrites archaeon]
MNFKKFILSGVLGGIVVTIVFWIVSMVMQTVLNYNAMNLDGMRAVEDPLMMLFFLYPFVISFTMAYAYPLFNLQGTIGKKGTRFGLLCFVLAGIPSIWVVLTSMNYPLGFTITQIISGILYYALSGMVIAKIME